MPQYPVEQINDRSVVVMSRCKTHMLVAELPWRNGEYPAMIEARHNDRYEGMGVDIWVDGKHDTAPLNIYIVRKPHESLSDMCDRLAIDEECLLPR